MTVFAAGLLVGLAVFKDDWDTQKAKAENFLGGQPPSHMLDVPPDHTGTP